ncbi:phage major tail protein, TP901-1 family [Jannaschia sp. W003]|uniref:phage major tail protein, TP901-1 family n=1 Tax=Jannaschia sp. W003 TaxID=2867012 RepID=UPI0021A567B4|nr:phage major tail protein, TP901-1 family [Jannaschia sp. W003]UWQ21004.1 phage major tail protein, TP901-1 family [Jannaschia sp. W003]
MAAQNGSDLLLKVDIDGNLVFETFAGLRTTRLSFNAAPVDVTAIGSPGGWRELLGNAGIRTASVSGAGVFRDEATDARARALFFDGAVVRWQVILPDFGIVEGPFQITALEYAGAHDGEATYEVSLASAGELTFSPIGVEP